MSTLVAVGMYDVEIKMVQFVEFLTNNPMYFLALLIVLPVAVAWFSGTSAR